MSRRITYAARAVLLAGVIVVHPGVVAAAPSINDYVEVNSHISGHRVITHEWAPRTELDLPRAEGEWSLSGGGQISATCVALTLYGYNRAKVDLVATQLNAEKVWAWVHSEYEDGQVVPGPYGSMQTVTVTVAIHGSATSQDNGRSKGEFIYGFSLDGPGYESGGGLSAITEPGTYTGTFDLNCGEWVTWRSSLDIWGKVNDMYSEAGGPHYGDGTEYQGAAFADFSKTVAITGFEYEDGSPAIGESGTAYPVPYTVPGSVEEDPTSVGAKLKAAGKLCKSQASYHAKKLKKPERDITRSLDKATQKFHSMWEKAEKRAARSGATDFPSSGSDVEASVVSALEDIYGAIRAGIDEPAGKHSRKHASALMKAVGKTSEKVLRAEAKHAKEPDETKKSTAVSKATAKFEKMWAKAAAKAHKKEVVYTGPDMAAVQAMIDDLVSDVLDDMNP